MTFGNIKSHKIPRLYPLSGRYTFGKTTGGGQINLRDRLKVKTFGQNAALHKYKFSDYAYFNVKIHNRSF